MRPWAVSIASPPLIGLLCASAAVAQSATDKTSSPIVLDQLSETAARDHKAGRISNLVIPQPDSAGARPLSETDDLPKRPDKQAVTIEPVVGRDRCDPAEAAAKSARCQKLAERRLAPGADASTGTSVTAEGRLLLLVNPNRPTMRDAVTGRPLSNTLGLGDPNGPADQLAGALRDQRDPKSDPAPSSVPDKSTQLPDGGTTILLPPK
ncbi:hypothetical protein ASG11_16220 [Sphingomonas sp. Leaf357]|uniref:hypothetical protein n=1 Tax=Sphingomonas sp. Leaf357 TaxID=1736350 RepID=UPI0006F8C84C|nr:hypothetical protein [Sphingomonas sp. Leaf357]KQS02306.1 hypothetical protein ASG11_16220 [Sphingomonas sp. Leaf357]